MNYLDLVEEYQVKSKIIEHSQFDKVLTLVTRAKDLYQGKSTTLKDMDSRKPTTIAQLEYRNGVIEQNIYEKSDQMLDEGDGLDG